MLCLVGQIQQVQTILLPFCYGARVGDGMKWETGEHWMLQVADVLDRSISILNSIQSDKDQGGADWITKEFMRVFH